MLKKLLLIAVVLVLFGCSDEAPVAQSAQPQEASPATTETAAAPQQQFSADHLLIFFLDPNGGPCRMQASILQEMGDELKGKVDVRYVQTTIKDDLQYFYAYGIRGLPSLVLADTQGKEIKRLAPGVNPAENIRQLLQAIPN
ncbi:thioredoxin 1 [Malonomonas rubra DSM 5091]|uniref:Thioredoxin 1 n=1 Tax=Malonomonas rubra DSM 5091 TaxID=1122189 RepID=A0A1M6MNE4_MALRU|nr:thioredoxin family protein [Malonomonas rubra]SHJ84793.1 thioredoxin 1 [Malonomonas rubra DSM 5091]